jgi:nitrite reductase/ring-hydroxylating ferredoxin subunit
MADGVRWVAVARLSELRDGDVIGRQAEGFEIALVRSGDQVFAVDDRCTHGDARLSDGFVLEHCIECPLHQGQFDLRTGAPLCEPVTEPVPIHAVRELGGAIEVALDAR